MYRRAGKTISRDEHRDDRRRWRRGDRAERRHHGRRLSGPSLPAGRDVHIQRHTERDASCRRRHRRVRVLRTEHEHHPVARSCGSSTTASASFSRVGAPIVDPGESVCTTDVGAGQLRRPGTDAGSVIHNNAVVTVQTQEDTPREFQETATADVAVPILASAGQVFVSLSTGRGVCRGCCVHLYAPARFMIPMVVKAGSPTQGMARVPRRDPPQKSVTIIHSSGPDLSHYSANWFRSLSRRCHYPGGRR